MINLYKYQGETPLQALDRLRKALPEYKDATLSYAGRLDPMAEGVLLVMVGDENNERKKYLGLDKEYTIEVLFGFETDTADILGLVTSHNPDKKCTQADIVDILQKYQGTFLQEYPAYSSRPVDGKPLYQWAREGKLREIALPKREVTIYSADVLDVSNITSVHVYNNIQQKVNKVTGDFRQKEILDMWKKHLDDNQSASYVLAQMKISCSSGTYMRSLAKDLGKELSLPACIFSITRTRVDDYTVELSTYL